MKEILNRAWWALLLRGIVSIVFGILALGMPGVALVSLIYIFAAYTLTDGIFSIAAAFRHRGSGNWGWLLFMGIISVLAGIMVLMFPGLTAILLVIFIGVRALFTGVFEIIAALRLRKEIEGEGWLIFSGLISVVFGLWVIAAPGAGALALLWLIGAYALIIGIVLLFLAFKARKWAST